MENNEHIQSAARSLLRMKPQTQIKTLITWFEYDQLRAISVYIAFLELVKNQEKTKQLIQQSNECVGSHHKQWYLYKIAKEIGCSPEELEEIDQGIAP